MRLGPAAVRLRLVVLIPSVLLIACSGAASHSSSSAASTGSGATTGTSGSSSSGHTLSTYATATGRTSGSTSGGIGRATTSSGSSPSQATSGSSSGSGTTSTAASTSSSGAVASSTSSGGGWWMPSDGTPLQFHWELSPASGVFPYPQDVVAGETIYDIDGQLTPPTIVSDLHSQGFTVICYMEVGSVETDRPDYPAFVDAGVVGAPVQGWPGEYWIDITNPAVLPLIQNRMTSWCQAGGFDAIEPDDSDVWENDPGFTITQAQNDQYNIQIAQMAHSLGLSIGLKNNPESAMTLEPYYDWALNEQCFQYQECSYFQQSFLADGKAVWDVEYTASGGGVPLTTDDCTMANGWQLNAMTRDLNLVGPNDQGFVYQPCIPDSQTTW